MELIIEELLSEWAYRSPKGYPDINDEADNAILQEILQERGLDFKSIEESVTVKYSEVTESEIVLLRKAIENIKEPLARYLTVFHYFDSNSLGTIAEVILSKLLNSQPGITSVHTGANGGLTDLTVNSSRISLKTTSEGAHISLANDNVRVEKGDVGKLAKILKDIYFEGESNIKRGQGTIPHTLKELIASDEISNEVKTALRNRIEAIAEKMAGADNEEKFIWIEKKYDSDKIIKELVIHILDYDKDEVVEELMNNYPYITDTAWGIKTKEGTLLVAADNHAKSINIRPEFIYETTKKETINIPLLTNINLDKVQVKDRISMGLFKALDVIYNTVLKK